MNDNSKWIIKISSSANVEDFTKEQIENILFCYNDQEYQDFRSEHTSKIEEEFSEHSVAQWQVKKSNEIEKKFFDNLKFDVKENVLSVNIEFDVNFTEDFDKGDVVEWVEGLHRIVKIYLMIGISVLMKKDENLYAEYCKGKQILNALEDNETIVVYEKN